eukprot:TRINITY_DN5845_c0_g1_i1.p1 TRINITY_DN5845_c0_g1~~TRINITY_DN5845_c0_g1_i1.p1  ORF type:complete len:251 (-),score=-15.20 TRINITY_DN5845_c0_g1_i1:2-754(-)
MALQRLSPLILLVVSFTLLVSVAHCAYYEKWVGGFTATYYGGQGDGGSCGYGTAAMSGFSVYTASASTVLYQDGALCGACLQVRCVNSRLCKPGISVPVTVSNLCPALSSGGWCDGNKASISLAPAVWNAIANHPEIGVVPVQVKRVLCQRRRGVVFNVTGNPYYIEAMIKNIAGSGDLRRVDISVGGGPWQMMTRNYGAVWAFSGQLLTQKSLSFRLFSRNDNASLAIWNALPPNWVNARNYVSRRNFS